MNFSATFLFKARKELLEAWVWYEDREPGLGDKFTEQVFSIVKIIEQFPDRYPERHKRYREALVRIFPYIIIYRIQQRKKMVVSVFVFHTRRNTKKKRII